MGEIVVIGLGRGRRRELTGEAGHALPGGQPLCLHTCNHPKACRPARSRLDRGDGRFYSFDRLAGRSNYNRRAPQSVARHLVRAALCRGTVYYAVPGRSRAGEAVLERLRRLAPRHGIKLKIIPARHMSGRAAGLYLPAAGGSGLGNLVEIMARLRSARGCPWDRRQSHRSLRQYLVEEAYEVVAAIDRNDDASLKEELGDLLLQVVFHSQIAREEGRFDLNQVIDGISLKLVRRHPHVFGTEKAATISQVIKNWEQIKQWEKGRFAGYADEALPALLAAYKIQKRAAGLGLDWPHIKGAVAKLREETAELEDAYLQNDSGTIEEEFGDFLFAVVNVARFLKINPELALGKALRKFISRLQYVLKRAEEKGQPVTIFSPDQLDRWWEEAKHKENITKKAGIMGEKAN